jgi:hypothetical protein
MNPDAERSRTAELNRVTQIPTNQDELCFKTSNLTFNAKYAAQPKD